METEKKAKIVYGYVRIEILFLDIPIDIINVIKEFLIFCDSWDTSYSTESIQVDVEQNTITQMAMHGSQSSTSYGKAIIDNTSGEQIWRFRILKYKSHSSWFIQIGIVKDDDKWLSKHCNIHVSTEWCRRTNGYAFCGGMTRLTWYSGNANAIRESYGESFNAEGDTLEMRLNVNEGTLKYIINGTDYGVAFDNIDKAKKYRLAVAISKLAKGSIIQLY